MATICALQQVDDIYYLIVSQLSWFVLSTQNIPVIGPSKAGAVLEGSKDFAKKFMKRHNIPTAQYETFDGEHVEEGLKFLETLKAPYVLKS